MAEKTLQDKIAIVTGASRGIGKAMALALARAGASVVVAARTAEPRANLPGTIHDTVAEIEEAGGRALAVACNVREEESIRDMVNRTLDEYGAVDVLVNNAGIGGYVPFLQMTLREWDLNMAINLRAPFIACQAAVPVMIEQGGGSIINVSSHAATNIFSSTLGEDHDAGIALVWTSLRHGQGGLGAVHLGLGGRVGAAQHRSQRPQAPASSGHRGLSRPATRRRLLHLGHSGGHGQSHRLSRRPGRARPHRRHSHRRGTGAAAGVVAGCRASAQAPAVGLGYHAGGVLQLVRK